MLSFLVARITHPHLSCFWRWLPLSAAHSELVFSTPVLGSPCYQALPLVFSSHQLDHLPLRLPLPLQFYVVPKFGAQGGKEEGLSSPGVRSVSILLYLYCVYDRLRKAKFC